MKSLSFLLIIGLSLLSVTINSQTLSLNEQKDAIRDYVIKDLHYQPADSGYRIVGSNNLFSRALYGGHENDFLTEKYITFAGDQPLILGAITDWRKSAACLHAKCGTLMMGVAFTPGVSAPVFQTPAPRGERLSQWLHDNQGTVSTYKNGWMEYNISTYAQSFPRITADVEVLPLNPDDGYIVHIRINSDQRVILALGFGGITGFLGRFEFPFVNERYFRPSDCTGNSIRTGENNARVTGPGGNSIETAMQIGTSFPVRVQVGDAGKTESPALFLANDTSMIESPMVKMSCEIRPGKTLEGNIVVLRNSPESALKKWLSHPDPVGYLKEKIRKTASALIISTPDHLLNLTLPPNLLAMDASWHEKSFYHGTYAWHAPYMGWRLWYGPTVIGWHDRVKKSFRTFAELQVPKTDKPEEVVFTGANQYSRLNNSYGFLPDMNDGRRTIFYNMQEVGVDMILHSIEWTGDLEYAGTVFDNIKGVLDWEKRILDPDNDDLYQNWLNTWVSDAHSYNGGGCAQSSAYNYRANKVMADIASKLGTDPEPFLSRSRNIHDAVQKTLWIPEKGVIAEYIDVIGNRLIHPSPELASVYHSIETGIVDSFQAYQMLKFTENVLRNERTKARSGRLVWSSDWYPQNYSSCGLYTAENIHLALAYFMCGQAKKGNDLLRGIVDAHFLNSMPGATGHCLASDGYSSGSTDFTDVNSMYLRMIVEGLFGIRFNLIDGIIRISPNLPPDWDHASLKIRDASFDFQREGQKDTYIFKSEARAGKIFSIPMRFSGIKNVLLNDRPVKYRIEPGIGCSLITVESNSEGEDKIETLYTSSPVPSLTYGKDLSSDQQIRISADRGKIGGIKDPSGCFSRSEQGESSVTAYLNAKPGYHTIFVRVKEMNWDGWLPADICITERSAVKKQLPVKSLNFYPVNISKYYNISLDEIHRQKYWNPRPKGYSIMTQLNGRFGWDWNQSGYQKIKVDDSELRSSQGRYLSDSGIPFATPERGPNAACVSVWENFPHEISFELSGKGDELEVFFIGVTNPMQSRVENVRFTVVYSDGTEEKVSLVNPVNFDDWLVAAVQQENETQYFSDYNHGIIQRIAINPLKELKSLKVTSVANEVITGILGISIGRQ
jgi:hypothetical protein